MARHNDNLCMFCDASPCSCNAKPARKVAVPRRPANEKSPASFVKRPDTRPKLVSVRKPLTPAAPDEGQSTSPGLSHPPEPQVSKMASVRSIRTQEESDLRAAVTALADAELLSAETLMEQRSRIDLPSWRIDAMIWKQGSRDQ